MGLDRKGIEKGNGMEWERGGDGDGIYRINGIGWDGREKRYGIEMWRAGM